MFAKFIIFFTKNYCLRAHEFLLMKSAINVRSKFKLT